MELKEEEAVYEVGEKEKEKKLAIKKKYLLFAILAAVSALGLLLTSRKEVSLSSNVDIVSVVKKVSQENRRETQEMVKQLAKQINLLTEEVQKLTKTRERVSPTKIKEQKTLAELEKKLKALEEKEKLKRESLML